MRAEFRRLGSFQTPHVFIPTQRSALDRLADRHHRRWRWWPDADRSHPANMHNSTTIAPVGASWRSSSPH